MLGVVSIRKNSMAPRSKVNVCIKNYIDSVPIGFYPRHEYLSLLFYGRHSTADRTHW